MRIKNLLVMEVGRWLHDDAVSAKNSKTLNLMVHIAEVSLIRVMDNLQMTSN